MYDNELAGNGNGTYNIKDTATGLKRNAMATAFWAMTPGPKMLWQFGELGFDYSINTCANLTVDPSGGCRLVQKPLAWSFYTNPNRLGLYNVYSKLINLRNTPKYINTFTTGSINYNLSNAFKSLIVTSDSLSVVVIGNFDVAPISGSVTFPFAGTWYSYLTGTTITASGNPQIITLQAGEYYVYTTRNLSGAVITAVNNVVNVVNEMNVSVYPNPVTGASTIQYYVPESGNVNISVYDMEGRKKASLLSGFKPKGLQTIMFNASDIGLAQTVSGNYLIQVDVNGQKKTEKIIVIK